MAEPYFDDGQIQLWHGDCREITAWLDADVLVTDPPYGRRYRKHGGGHASNNSTQTMPTHPGIPGNLDTTTRDAALALWGTTRRAAVFGDLMLTPPAGTRQVLVYEAPPGSGLLGARYGWRRNVQAVYLLGSWPRIPSECSAVLRSNTRNGPTFLAARHGHPHAKPVDVLEQLLAACPPGVVADPFAGSGSTLIAARNQGRRAVGVEIDEKYAEAAARRLSQTALDLGGAR